MSSNDTDARETNRADELLAENQDTYTESELREAMIYAYLAAKPEPRREQRAPRKAAERVVDSWLRGDA